MNFYTTFDLNYVSNKVLIILGVIILVVLFAIPTYMAIKNKKNISKKIKDDTPKKAKEINDKKLIFVTDFEKNRPIPKKENKMFGLFNGVGHNKSAIRMKSLVYVYPERDSCRLCQKYEGTVLSLEELDNKYITMKEAISNGYHHIGCKHIDIDYYENETQIPKSPWSKKEQTSYHNKILELFRLEEKVRVLTFQIDNNLSESIAKDEEKLERLEIEIKNFCLENEITYSGSRLNPYAEIQNKFKYVSKESWDE